MTKRNVIDLANLEDNPEIKARFVEYAVEGFFDTLNVSEDEDSEKDSMTVVVDKQHNNDKDFYFNLNNISDKSLKQSLEIILDKGIPERYIIEIFEKLFENKKEKFLELADQGVDISDNTIKYMESLQNE